MNILFKYSLIHIQWLFTLIYVGAAIIIVLGLIYLLWMKLHK